MNDINKSYDSSRFYLDSSNTSFKIDTSTWVKAIKAQNRIRSQKISRNKYQSNKPGILKHFACSRILTKQNQGINTEDDYPLSELPEGESFIIYSPIDRIANYPISPKFPLMSLKTSSTPSKDRVSPVKILFGTSGGNDYKYK